MRGGGWGEAYRKDEGNAAADGLGAVELGGVAQPQLLVARGILPADDGGAVEENFEGLAGGEGGDDLCVVVGEVDLGLWGQSGGGGEGRGLVRSVYHGAGSGGSYR